MSLKLGKVLSQLIKHSGLSLIPIKDSAQFLVQVDYIHLLIQLVHIGREVIPLSHDIITI